MAITMKQEGRRIYLEGNTWAIKDKIKSMGGAGIVAVAEWQPE